MTTKREYRPASEWSELVSLWRTSGKSQREFSSERGIKPSTLAAWARRLKRGGGASVSSSRRSKKFSEVHIVAPAVASGGGGLVEVTTPTGVVIRLSGGLDASALRAVLEEISRC